MTLEAALEAQIERYRRMPGAERVEIALRLHELSCDIARDGTRDERPDANEAEVEHLLRQRIQLARTL